MKNLDLNACGVQEMQQQEMINTNGGFIPLVFWGVAISAKAVAGMVGACFLAGVGVGAAVASDQR